MAAFASVADLAAYLQESIPDGDPTATLAIEMASATIQAYTRQTIEAVNGDSVTLHGLGRRLLVLPELPVRDVTSVTLNGTALDSENYSWNEQGLLRRPNSASWGETDPVVVVYDHGYITIPEPLRAVCIAAAGRAFLNPGSVVREQIGTYSVAFATAGPNQGAGVDLLSSEKLVLDGYRHRGLA